MIRFYVAMIFPVSGALALTITHFTDKLIARVREARRGPRFR